MLCFGDELVTSSVGKTLSGRKSRLARNALDQAQTDAFVNKLGIALVSIEDPITGNSATGKLSRGMQRLINAWFSDSLAERAQDRMRAAVRGGGRPLHSSAQYEVRSRSLRPCVDYCLKRKLQTQRGCTGCT